MTSKARRPPASSKLLIALLSGVCLLASPACKTSPRNQAALTDGEVMDSLDEGQVNELGAYVAAVYAGEQAQAPAFLSSARGSAYVALRAQGKLIGESWGSDGSMAESLAGAIAQAKAATSESADMIEIDLAHSFRSFSKPSKKDIYSNASGKRVGIRGIELSHGEHSVRVAPTTMLAAGERFNDVVDRFFKDTKHDHESFAAGGKLRVFEAHQLLVRVPSGEAVALLRGNVYVRPEQVTQANTQATTDLLVEWMLTNLQPDGRMVYLWWPGESIEKPNDNNMIRQWMATNALIKVAESGKYADKYPDLWDRVAKNIDYNLEHFYRQDGEFGLIEHQNQVKLGALSLAAMAIVNHPQRARWQTQEHGLRRSVAELWNESGMFDCFFKPRGKSDPNANVQNFYPGETLLLWAQLYRDSRDPELLRRFIQSFHYYKTWHLDPSDRERRRPSFVPWHTQADFILWETLRAGPPTPPPAEGEAPPAEGETPPAEGETPTVELTPEGWPVGTTPATPPTIELTEIAAFVFDMNDWLIENMEVWEESAFDDEKGRFYSRKRDYGSPHASATGVYIEGMIDAYEMAKILGDEPRRKRYALALSRAIRSVMQLQFVDDVDMYYVTDRVHTKGGLRTTVLRNEVRVDNVQHVLMGVLKVLDRFAPEEFRTD